MEVEKIIPVYQLDERSIKSLERQLGELVVTRDATEATLGAMVERGRILRILRDGIAIR